MHQLIFPSSTRAQSRPALGLTEPPELWEEIGAVCLALEWEGFWADNLPPSHTEVPDAYFPV
jgi:hypothetical protein